ncbi:hypothetical protein SpAn4DRAFT_1313 [Sporomusa ovata]|uniref:Uncharacterized protein n=1 Tax=Sporomusa ovata TaxID=2378 RepID=A0A0U1KUI2_9FIRM|nr:hypothetical protein [Sporomusa ovata]CQR70344.1 hypothetical protein SpAn4DRAFT_1313 [Sporomusa ovata]
MGGDDKEGIITKFYILQDMLFIGSIGLRGNIAEAGLQIPDRQLKP